MFLIDSLLDLNIHESIKGCYKLFNGVVTRINGKEALILLCKRGEIHASIEIVNENKEVTTLDLKDTDA